MKGTDTKPPPAPTMPDRVPIRPPVANMPGAPGSARDAAGFLPISIWVAEKATNTPKKAASTVESICLPIQGPIQEPIRMPGASSFTTGHRTAPCWWWARTEDREVNRMVASEVAIAMWMVSSGAKPRAVKIIVMKGTSTMPPPMPSSPAAKPPKVPIASSARIRVRSISASLRAPA